MDVMENIKLVLTQNIKGRRKQLQINQEQLAEKSGLSIGYIKNIERGISWPSPESIEALAKGLSTSVSALMNEQAAKAEVVRVSGRTTDLLRELIFRREKIPEDVIDMAQGFELDDEVWEEVREAFEDAIKRRKTSQKNHSLPGSNGA